MIILDCSQASCCWFGQRDRNQVPLWRISESLDVCVAGLAGQASSTEVHSRRGLGPVVTVTVGGAVVVDLRPPGVCGDDPRCGPPLLQGVRSFNSLLDLFSCAFQGSIRLYSWRTAKNLDENHILQKKYLSIRYQQSCGEP